MNIGVSIPLPAYLVDPGLMARKAEERPNAVKTDAEMAQQLTRIAETVLK
jgi:hypothetical protein